MEDSLAKFGGRKFVFACITSSMAFTLAVLSILEVHEFLNFIQFIFATYVAGNLLTKATEKIK